MKTLITILLLASFAFGTYAEPRKRHESRNYILRRQEAGLVRGVPTSRLIIGKREIDIYPNGLMFERDHLVGIKGTKQ